MTKAEFIKAMVESGAYATRNDAERAYDCVFGVLSESLKGGHEVRVQGFGVFRVKDRPARQGRNPRTGRLIDIAASKAVAFRQSSKLFGVLI